MSLNLEKQRMNKERDRKKAEQGPRKKKEVFVFKSYNDEVAWRLKKMEELSQTNPDAVKLPPPPSERRAPRVREFNPNIQSSSAGAGSGEFHVYRHSRRREQFRQEYLDWKDRKERDAEDFKRKREDSLKEEDDKTAKNRAKRQRKKQKQLMAKKRRLAEKAVEAAEAEEGEDSGDAAAPADDADASAAGEDEEHFVIGGR